MATIASTEKRHKNWVDSGKKKPKNQLPGEDLHISLCLAVNPGILEQKTSAPKLNTPYTILKEKPKN